MEVVVITDTSGINTLIGHMRNNKACKGEITTTVNGIEIVFGVGYDPDALPHRYEHPGLFKNITAGSYMRQCGGLVQEAWDTVTVAMGVMDRTLAQKPVADYDLSNACGTPYSMASVQVRLPKGILYLGVLRHSDLPE